MGHPNRLRGQLGGGAAKKLTAAARALYWRRPDAAAMSGLGLRASDFRAPEVELWAENWPPVQLFVRYSTQWRVGMAGPVGLDYVPILHDLDRRKLSCDEFDDMMDCIRMLERAALDEMNDDS